MHEIFKRELCGAASGIGLKRLALGQPDAWFGGNRVAASPKTVEPKQPNCRTSARGNAMQGTSASAARALCANVLTC